MPCYFWYSNNQPLRFRRKEDLDEGRISGACHKYKYSLAYCVNFVKWSSSYPVLAIILPSLQSSQNCPASASRGHQSLKPSSGTKMRICKIAGLFWAISSATSAIASGADCISSIAIVEVQPYKIICSGTTTESASTRFVFVTQN